MKRINKPRINSDRLMKNDELMTLRGGYGSCCVCLNKSGTVMGYMSAYDQASCDAACDLLGWDGSYGSWSYC